MSLDCSRFSFQPWYDFLGVLMQQGRVQLDSDWNEWVAQLSRRLHAGTLDTVGRAVVPRTTPNGFLITAAGGVLSIGPGRMYVDGIMAENHGGTPLQWDRVLAEQTGTADVPFLAQPYLPFNAANQVGPGAVFNAPTINGGPHLVYLDVWPREVTHLQVPELIEKAVGIDTTARLQTVWQVKVLSNVGNITCATPDDEVDGRSAATQPSGARLTTSTGDVPGDENPCLTPPAAGYKGLENQLYRVEIHRGGLQAQATFKWSRDNATVATRVTEIHDGNRLVVESLGRDDVLSFHDGEWIEVLDDWHELHERPGVLRQIRLTAGVDAATRSILLIDVLPAGLLPVDGDGRVDAARHTRIRRWDQSGIVRRADGTTFHDLGASASSDGIPVSAAGTQLALEDGILVEFTLAAGGEFKAGDHWVFAARSADGSIEELSAAPPRGIHHHYARLAVVTLPDNESDCRQLWPKEMTGESCDCTVCVHPAEHNAGTATIQQAIDSVRTRGGTVCLDAGGYTLRAPLNLDGARSVRLRGQGYRTLLQAAESGTAITCTGAVGLTIENLAILGATPRASASGLIDARNCVDLRLSHLVVVAASARTGALGGVAVSLAGVMLATSVDTCTFAAERGVIGADGEHAALLAAQLRITDNLFLCRQQGVHLARRSVYGGRLRVRDNLFLGCADAAITALGGALAQADVEISDNLAQVAGSGIVAGTGQLRVRDNVIVGVARSKHGIALAAGLDRGPAENVLITGNRVQTVGGHGIVMQRAFGEIIVKTNVIRGVGEGALVMESKANARYLCVDNNHFLEVGEGSNAADQAYHAVLLSRVMRVDVVSNLFAGIARSAQQGSLRTALLLAGGRELRVAGNRMHGIGPARFAGRTIGIAVSAGAGQIALDDNSVSRVSDASEAAEDADWQAIVLGGPASRVPGAGIAAPRMLVADLNQEFLLLSEVHVATWARGTLSASLRGNQVRSPKTRLPAVLVERATSLLLHHNDAEASNAGHASAPVVLAVADHASVTGNRLIGDGRHALELVANAERCAVLGNVTRRDIVVNGAPLPVPFAALNITLP